MDRPGPRSAAQWKERRFFLPECTRTRSCAVGKPFATYPAYLCPLHCGGAVSHSRLRTTILHSECGDCKRFCEHLTTNLGSPAQTAFEGSLW